MNSNQFRRNLASKGGTFDTAGKGGHITVRLGERTPVMPTHDGSKQLGTGLIMAIKKQLGVV